MSLWDKSVGLDISDRSIKIVELVKFQGKIKLGSKSRLEIAAGMVERGQIKDQDRLAVAVKEVMTEAKPHPIRAKKLTFGLPDSQVYVHFLTWDKTSPGGVKAAIREAARNNMPIKEDDLLFSYAEIGELEGKTQFLLVGTSKQVFEQWQQFFQGLSLEAIFDIESLAVRRALALGQPQTPVAVLDFGMLSTRLIIFSHQGLAENFDSRIVGDILTQALVQELQVSETDAQKLKVETGVRDSQQPAYGVLTKKLDLLVTEVGNNFQYFHQKTGSGVEKLLLIGGGSQLPGLVDYLNQQLNLPVEMARSPYLSDGELAYVEAIGLGLRGYHRPEDSHDPSLQATSLTSLQTGLGRNVSQVISRKTEEEEVTKMDESDSTGQQLLATPEDIKQIKKLGQEKKLLTGVLAAGLLAILMAGWYRYDQQAKKSVGIQAGSATPPVTTSAPLPIPVTDDSEGVIPLSEATSSGTLPLIITDGT